MSDANSDVQKAVPAQTDVITDQRFARNKRTYSAAACVGMPKGPSRKYSHGGIDRNQIMSAESQDLSNSTPRRHWSVFGRINRTRHCLEPVSRSDFPQILSLAESCFNADAIEWVRRSISFHEKSANAGLDDGRRFFKVAKDRAIIGVCGIHHYDWGPIDVCWASWFFIDPLHRRPLLGWQMAASLLHMAESLGYRTLYIETDPPESVQFGISHLLARAGMEPVARIPCYYGSATDMVVYRLLLAE
ncbi:MAG: GNAT family N-acetyltransferase [Rhodospirillaceae bacterium]|nr:GNAT family N-acetyltransferase [Rhodospirillaceae bacterium]